MQRRLGDRIARIHRHGHRESAAAEAIAYREAVAASRGDEEHPRVRLDGRRRGRPIGLTKRHSS